MNPQLTAEEDAIISSLLAKIEQGLYGFFTKYNCEARLDPRSFGRVYPIVANKLDPTIRNLPRNPAALRLLIEEMHCRMLEYEVQIGDDEDNRSLEDWMNIARVMTLSVHIHRVAGDLTCSLGSHMYTALSQGVAEIASGAPLRREALWKSLANEHDTMRRRYWEHRIREAIEAQERGVRGGQKSA
ncbi:hypothetical protein NMY22_g9345 [Coprinellus aureogranulatus]|nr:hypothetical protein NMY22_g9345 [Coprinellus aureogranulatus]